MKKTLAILLSVCLLAALTGCAARKGYESADTAAPSPPGTPDLTQNAPSGGDAMDMDTKPTEPSYEGDVTGSLNLPTQAADLSEKIIYSADASIETKEFDKSVAAVQALVERCGAFLESSSVSGNSYRTEFYGGTSYRSAQFVIRVPVAAFTDMTGSLETLGNVTYFRTYTENITVRFTDTQARLDACRIEQERLMEMLKKADYVGDMLEIERYLTDVRYEIESLESTLRNWQNQVDYSTVTVSLSEVEELTRIEQPNRSYWQRMSDGFKRSMEDVGEFFQDLFMGMVLGLPSFLIIAAVAVAVFFIVRALVRRRKAKKRRASASVEAAASDENVKP